MCAAAQQNCNSNCDGICDATLHQIPFTIKTASLIVPLTLCMNMHRSTLVYTYSVSGHATELTCQREVEGHTATGTLAWPGQLIGSACCNLITTALLQARPLQSIHASSLQPISTRHFCRRDRRVEWRRRGLQAMFYIPLVRRMCLQSSLAALKERSSEVLRVAVACLNAEPFVLCAVSFLKLLRVVTADPAPCFHYPITV